MAEITKVALKVDNNTSFPNNNAGAITPTILRTFNINMIDSLVDEIGYNADSGSWNQQIDALEQFTASASGLTTGSLLITASAAGNVITFTKGNNSTFNVTVATGSIPDISNLNQATASLQAFTQSAQVSINNLNTTTASLNTSVSNINTFTASADVSITNLNTNSASLNTSVTNINTFTASQQVSIDALNASSASQQISIDALNVFTASQSTASLVNSINELNTFTASANVRLNNIEFTTASLNTSVSNLNTNSASVNTSITNLNSATSSLFTSASLGLVTASVSGVNITFSKGDGTQFTIQTATGSVVSASYAETASLAINAKDIVVDVKNTTGIQINKGTVVRIIGSTGDNPLIGTASWTDDDNSANTLGFVVDNIPNDDFGRVMTQGTLLGINTDPILGYTAGQLIYLSSSGQFTNVLPPAPYHEVRLGQVLRAQQNNGSIYVLVQNGYELTELHDVDINTGSLANNDLLAWDSSSQQWVNKTVTGVGALTTASFNSLTGSFATTSSFNAYTASVTQSIVTAIVTNNGSSNYIIDGVAKPKLSFVPGPIYRFDLSGIVGSHPFKFSTTPNGPTEYTTGVTSGSNFIQIEVGYDTTTPLYYYCTIHSGMGNEINVLGIDKLVTTASFNAYTASQSTGSFATTGSNSFTGQQQITNGNVRFNTTGSFTTNGLQWNNSKIFQDNFLNFEAQGNVGVDFSTNGLATVPGININFRNQNTAGAVQFQTTDGAITLRASGTGRNVELSGSAVTLNNVSFIPFSASLDTRILAVTGSSINTGSFATTGSNNFIGNQVISGSLLVSGSNTIDVNVIGRVSITGPTSGQTPRLFISSSDATSELGRGFQTLDTTNTTGLNAFQYLSSNVAKQSDSYVAVYNSDFSVDVEMEMFANSSSIGLADWDNGTTFSYVPFLTVAPNLGDNPAPRMTRGLDVTGNTTITGSLLVSGSNTIDVNVVGRVSITGPGTGATAPRLFISGSDGAITDIARNFNNINTTKVTSVLDASGQVFANTSSVAGMYVGVYDDPNFNTDVELNIIVTKDSGSLCDWDNSNGIYVPFLTVQPNTGNNPTPVMTRGLAITGSLSMSGSVNFATGSNKQAGTAVLDGGTPATVTVSNSLVTTNSIIMLTKQTNATTASVSISAKSSGSFTITSTVATDADTVGWFIINNS